MAKKKKAAKKKAGGAKKKSKKSAKKKAKRSDASRTARSLSGALHDTTRKGPVGCLRPAGP